MPAPQRIRRVLLLYADRYYLVKQVYPFGLDCLAAHLRTHGLDAALEYPFLPSEDPAQNVRQALDRHRPDLVCLAVRNLDTCMSCEEFGDFAGPGFRTFWLLQGARQVCAAVREHRPDLPVLAGGTGFSIAPEAALEFLGADWGVAGEGEGPILDFARAWPDRAALESIPNLVWRGPGGVTANPRRSFSFAGVPGGFARDPGFAHALETVALPVRVKRGCARACSFCVEPGLEGRRILYRDPAEVVAELRLLDQAHPEARNVFFVDTEFNVPDAERASALVRALVDAGLHERFSFASQFLPRPFDRDLAALLAEAGFSVVLTCDSLSDLVLAANNASYRKEHGLRTLELCREFGLPLTMTLVFGLPGEDWATLEETARALDRFPPGPAFQFEYAVGGRVYQGTPLAAMAEKSGGGFLHGRRTPGWLEPCFWCQPLPPLELKERLDGLLGFAMAFHNRVLPDKRQSLAVHYLADHGRWDEGLALFLEGGPAVLAGSFDRFFRGAADAGRPDVAGQAARAVLDAAQADPDGPLAETAGLAGYYLMLLQGAGGEG